MGDIIQEEKKIGRLFAEAFGLTIAENFFSTQIPADKICNQDERYAKQNR